MRAARAHHRSMHRPVASGPVASGPVAAAPAAPAPGTVRRTAADRVLVMGSSVALPATIWFLRRWLPDRPHRWSDLGRWAVTASPDALAGHLAWLALVLTAVGLAVAPAVALSAVVARAHRRVRVARRCSIGRVGRCSAAGLLVTGLGTAGGTTPAAAADRPAALEPAAPDHAGLAGGTDPAADTGGPPTGVPVLHLVVDDAPVPTMHLLDASLAAVAVADRATDTTGTSPAPEGTWVVRPGDCFWTVAEEVASTHDTDALSDVHGYWLRLIAANRGRLADPDDADLLFVGQVLRLPDW